MATKIQSIEIKTRSGSTQGSEEVGLKILTLYAVGFALTLLLNWYFQPYSLFWG